MKDNFSILQKRKGLSCRGCLITVWIIVFIIIGFSVYISRCPFYKPFKECYENAEMDLLPALERYYSSNNRYPDSLEQLQNDYLKDKNSIYCPIHKGKKHVEYKYCKPDSPDSDEPVIICTQHIIFGKKAELGYTLKGQTKAKVIEQPEGN